MERIDREYAIINIDKEGESLTFHDYTTNDTISDYYKQSGFLQWNFYLIIAKEAVVKFFEGEDIDKKIKAIEDNEFYTRKFVIESEKIDAFIAERFPVLKKEHGTIILIKGDSYDKAHQLASTEYLKFENEFKTNLIGSWYRDFNSLYALTEMDKLRAELINNSDKCVIFYTHISYEFSLAEKKFKLFRGFIEYEDKGDRYRKPKRQTENDVINIRLYCEHKKCRKFILGVEGYNGSFHAETGQYCDLRDQGWYCIEHRPKKDVK